MSENKFTCLHDKHVALGALMSPFGGFDMPIQYKGIVEEHNAVRNAVGVFDVSHMGEVHVTGPEAQKFVNYIFTNDITKMEIGGIQYGMMLYPNGGTVDDLLVYTMGENDYFLVINAANIDKDVAWINEQAANFDVKVENQSESYGQIAVQGPEAEKTMKAVLNLDCTDLTFYTFKCVDYNGDNIIVSRTGYTGEDGFEVYASHKTIQDMWDMLMDAGVQPCGLGCRDTLRFEVGLPLYGDELTADITPIMAGFGFFVKLDKEDFIGKDVCAQQKAEGAPKKLVGLELHDKAIPRHGYEVCNENEEPVGYVTTGYRGISVDKSIAVALVDAAYGKLGTPLKVHIRKKFFDATVVKKKFHDKSYKK
ncbi:MAG: glycine cleavage system aminomethyltransferase GcvT [Muribaculaceae bacterium]|nr:glycine cleavage system aminomethyltransferase GcvT [Muribaculaceae bacterium]MBR0025157.1 glycine cleavage system aminomethyltransferase GcvT [Muribaculaceae bacterium]